MMGTNTKNLPQPMGDPDQRRPLLAQIHIAQKTLGLDESAYRDILQQIIGRRSCRSATLPELERVVAHLTGRAPGPRRRRGSPERQGQIAKIRALLINHPDGPLPDGYADGIARAMYGVDQIIWCDPIQLRGVIAALEKHTRRAQRGQTM